MQAVRNSKNTIWISHFFVFLSYSFLKINKPLRGRRSIHMLITDTYINSNALYLDCSNSKNHAQFMFLKNNSEHCIHLLSPGINMCSDNVFPVFIFFMNWDRSPSNEWQCQCNHPLSQAGGSTLLNRNSHPYTFIALYVSWNNLFSLVLYSSVSFKPSHNISTSER